MLCLADGDYTLWLVIDTNILIEDLERLKEFHRNVTMGGANGPFKDINFLIVYYIPKKVNSELCAQKERGEQHRSLVLALLVRCFCNTVKLAKLLQGSRNLRRGRPTERFTIYSSETSMASRSRMMFRERWRELNVILGSLMPVLS